MGLGGDDVKYWQVYNAHGRMYLAEGDSAEEAIDNARPLFASNRLYDGPGRPPVPNPAYAQVGMTAVVMTADSPTIQFCFCPPMDDSSDPDQHQTGCIYREWLYIWNRHRSYSSPFRDRQSAASVVSPGCREASFGWVHVRPSCRCSR